MPSYKPCPSCPTKIRTDSAMCIQCSLVSRRATASAKRFESQGVSVGEPTTLREEVAIGPLQITIAPVGYLPEPGPPPRGRGRKHLVIPDCQVKDGVDTRHLRWIGKYIVKKRPDVVVCIGDFADMPSLCSYDRGKKTFEGRRYRKDVEASIRGMAELMGPLMEFNQVQAASGLPEYHPRLVMTLGNHEDRIRRATEDDARLDGTIGLSDLRYEEFGWEVHPFLEVVKIDGVEYSHYFTTGVMGRPVTSAAALLRERSGSAVMGHVQHTDIAVHRKTQEIAIFAGTCYLHDEDYLTPQGNNCRRQIVVLHEVEDGHFDPMFVSLNFLESQDPR